MCNGGYGLQCDAYGSISDKAGNNYKTVVINGLTWMAENMAYVGQDITCYANTSAENGDPDFIQNYGCLYTFEDAQKVCPSGWSLPTSQQFRDLLAYTGVSSTPSNVKHLRAESWNAGLDTYGFAALPAGYYAGKTGSAYINFGTNAHFWTGTINATGEITTAYLYDNYASVSSGNRNYQAYSVRCVKVEDFDCGAHGVWNENRQKCICNDNFTGPACNECQGAFDLASGCTACQSGFDINANCNSLLPGYMADDAGQAYKTVRIGMQIWMAENMAYHGGTGIHCLANRKDPPNGDPDFTTNYGCLYNWAEAQKVCPSADGWRLPTETDFERLLAYVAANRTSDLDFLALIAESAAWTNYPDGGDDFGFSALPAGYMLNNGSLFFGKVAHFWSTTPRDDDDNGTVLKLEGAHENNHKAFIHGNPKDCGSSVRCVKDACNSGFVGENCDIAITCVNGNVDPTSGHCLPDSCTGHFTGLDCNECQDHWGGDDCQSCAEGWAGNNCHTASTCANGTTDPTNGHCLPGSCTEGATGLDCDECIEGYYGHQCAPYGSMTDKVGYSYKTVMINGREWMAENMGYGANVTCHADTSRDPEFRTKYGCLYIFEDAQRVCPDGWRLPSEAEFEELLIYVDTHKKSQNEFLALAGKVTWGYYSAGILRNITGLDEFGFGALPVGWYDDHFKEFGFNTSYWSNTVYENDDDYFYGLLIMKGSASILLRAKSNAYSVRCIKKN